MFRTGEGGNTEQQVNVRLRATNKLIKGPRCGPIRTPMPVFCKIERQTCEYDHKMENWTAS